MLNCKEATRLMSEKLDHRLTLGRRIHLRLHVMMCGACLAYKRQVEALHRLFTLRRRSSTPMMPSGFDARLSPERRSLIKRLLEVDSSGHTL